MSRRAAGLVTLSDSRHCRRAHTTAVSPRTVATLDSSQYAKSQLKSDMGALDRGSVSP